MRRISAYSKGNTEHTSSSISSPGNGSLRVTDWDLRSIIYLCQGGPYIMGTSASFNPKNTPRLGKYELHYFTNPLYLSFLPLPFPTFTDVLPQMTLVLSPRSSEP